MRDSCLRYYLPCATPVQAGEYRDVSSLEGFRAWVDRYRGLGFVDDNVSFTVKRRGQGLVGVLRTPLGEGELSVGDFLVFNGHAFFVNRPDEFWRDYRDIDGVVTLPRSDPRVAVRAKAAPRWRPDRHGRFKIGFEWWVSRRWGIALVA